MTQKKLLLSLPSLFYSHCPAAGSSGSPPQGQTISAGTSEYVLFLFLFFAKKACIFPNDVLI